MQLLLHDARVDPSAGYNKVIIWASRNGNVAVVQLLLADERVIEGGGIDDIISKYSIASL